MTTHKAIREALEAGPVQYACHCDLEPGMQPDGCVLDEGKPQDCVYARVLTERGLCKTDCQEWKPINVMKPTIEVSAANLRALLADLDAKTAEVERYRITQGYGAVIGGDKEVKAGATLKGTP